LLPNDEAIALRIDLRVHLRRGGAASQSSGAKVTSHFMFGLHAGAIATTSTNRIDMEYFEYLPLPKYF
jgi:hypothetical protein